MTGESTLQLITPDELPELLTQLHHEQTTDFALVGQNTRLSTSPKEWPKELQGRVVYQLTGCLKPNC